ncbi:MAG: hypothetical protein FWF77_00160, partial [Defluviitaleaceae bacterium]|nr:hypothetical protein [Defluviitaleaceae bacterium]
MKMKKIIAILTAIALITGLLPASAFAAELTEAARSAETAELTPAEMSASARAAEQADAAQLGGVSATAEIAAAIPMVSAVTPPGDGTSAAPWQISTPAHLVWVRENHRNVTPAFTTEHPAAPTNPAARYF